MASPVGQGPGESGEGNVGDGPLGPVKREAHELAEHAQHSVEVIADESKNAAADYVWALATAVRSGADELEQRHRTRSASVVRQAAEDCDRLARNFAERGPREAVSHLTGFASRHPVMFLSAAILAGAGIVQLISNLEEEPRQ